MLILSVFRRNDRPYFLVTVGIKFSFGKLDISGKTADFFNDADINGIIILPIKPSYLTVLESLPLLPSR